MNLLSKIEKYGVELMTLFFSAYVCMVLFNFFNGVVKVDYYFSFTIMVLVRLIYKGLRRHYEKNYSVNEGHHQIR